MGTALSDLPPLRDVIQQYELWANKKLGQNFLLDMNITDRIVRVAGDVTDSTVLEIGPGPGGLTRSILKAGAKKLIAVEKDSRCVTALQEIKQAVGDQLDIIEGDALAIDLCALSTPPRRIIANLPYNVATPLLIGWLKKIQHFQSLTLMFQKEVAEKIVGAPGSKDFGRLSVICQWLTVPKIMYHLPNSAFVPPPKVASSVVHFVPREKIEKAEFHKMEQITAAAFGQRRKMLRSSLKKFDLDFEKLGIDPTKRAEELPVADFCAMAREF